MATAYITAPRSVAEELVAVVESVHPYDVPCIERFEDAPVDAFRAWRDEQVE